ncbi:MAG: sugar ABC transporter permease [Anaerolineae bacterium]|nr:sugar ABC transporter permease [Anaerolineae bacterium]
MPRLAPRPANRLSGRRRREIALGYLFISPAILGLVVWTVGPLVFSIWLAFQDWDIVSTARFVGLENFRTALFGDEFFWISLWVTFKYTIVSVPTTLTVSFLLALLLNANVRGMPVYRTLFYMPSLTPAVAGAALWKWIYNPEYGLANYFLRQLGLPKLNWLFDPVWVMPALWLMNLWGAGGGTVIFLAGLQGVPKEYYDAASIDGANAWGRFRHITIPMVSPIIFYNLIIGIINTFQVFTAGYLMTNGGPSNATLFYVLYLYRNAFKWLNMGYASALAWILFLLVLVVTMFVFKYIGQMVYYQEEIRA